MVSQSFFFTSVEYKRRVRPDEHGDGAGSAAGPSRPGGVHRDVAAHRQGQPSVPSRRLYPVDGIKEGGGAAVAGVGRVHALEVLVARVAKQLEKDS